MQVCVRETERETETETGTGERERGERDRDRERQRETERDRERQRERDKERQRQGPGGNSTLERVWLQSSQEVNPKDRHQHLRGPVWGWPAMSSFTNAADCRAERSSFVFSAKMDSAILRASTQSVRVSRIKLEHRSGFRGGPEGGPREGSGALGPNSCSRLGHSISKTVLPFVPISLLCDRRKCFAPSVVLLSLETDSIGR